MQHAGTTPANPLQQWQWKLELGGFDAGWFTECSGIKVENRKVLFGPAGSMQDQKTAGRMVWDDITLKKGKSQEGTDNALVEWHRQVADARAGKGGQPEDYMRDIDLIELARDETEVRRWRIYGAFPTKAEFGEFKGDSDEVVVETLTLAFQFAEQVA